MSNPVLAPRCAEEMLVADGTPVGTRSPPLAGGVRGPGLGSLPRMRRARPTLLGSVVPAHLDHDPYARCGQIGIPLLDVSGGAFCIFAPQRDVASKFLTPIPSAAGFTGVGGVYRFVHGAIPRRNTLGETRLKGGFCLSEGIADDLEAGVSGRERHLLEDHAAIPYSFSVTTS